MSDERRTNACGSSLIVHRSALLFRRNLHEARLLASQRQVVSAQSEFNRITQRGPADDLDLCPVHNTHLKQPAAKLGITTDIDDLPTATDAQLAQGTGGDRRGLTERGCTGSF